MDRIPKDHPRYRSLITREKLVAAGELVASAGLIAHGRGEAFDYLLGEKTTEPAHCAINAAAGLLCNARQPVISANGNTVALAGPAIAELATTLPARVEVNLFHRSSARVGGLVALLRQAGIEPLGERPDFRIPGLASERAKCCRAGIGNADVVLVPLEDGDRCQALVNLGKKVIAIDLNPLSRTARTAHVTIVDELTRCLPLLIAAVNRKTPVDNEFDNEKNLAEVMELMCAVLGNGEPTAKNE